ncbi:hypothetical protein LCGC14_1625980 [marine sediment metagenome]|uniref:Uncharacterized protein n=1 Tax=marine sediment metagenome TaxID=412755 RepID=A0A0F9I434_9ZZZZ
MHQQLLTAKILDHRHTVLYTDGEDIFFEPGEDREIVNKDYPYSFTLWEFNTPAEAVSFCYGVDWVNDSMCSSYPYCNFAVSIDRESVIKKILDSFYRDMRDEVQVLPSWVKLYTDGRSVSFDRGIDWMVLTKENCPALVVVYTFDDESDAHYFSQGLTLSNNPTFIQSARGRVVIAINNVDDYKDLIHRDMQRSLRGNTNKEIKS